MSIHSSLRGGGKGRKFRSVLKRFERLKVLKDKNLWTQDSSVLGLPKVKQQKLKVKKAEKAAPKEGEAAPAAGAAPAAAAAKTAAPAAPAKGAKEQGKSDKK